MEECLAHRGELPDDLDRGIYRALAAAYQTLGDAARSRKMLEHSGFASLDGKEPRVVSSLSVDAVHGFRFGEKRLVREADGVYVAEGYDFANIAFIVGPSSVVAIDAGTTEPSAREAVLDVLAGDRDGAFVRTADELIGRGDAALALRIAELGLTRYPASAALLRSREQALLALREINSAANPFRFIVYSESARQGLASVSPR